MSFFSFLNASQLYNISSALGLSSQGTVRGGLLKLTWQIGTEPAKTYTFGLWGMDPSLAAVKARVGACPGVPWWGVYVVQSESSSDQFNYVLDSPPDFTGTPLFGPPCGFGIMQLDPPRSIADVWNWQSNVDDGVAYMKTLPAKGTNQLRIVLAAYNKNLNPSKQPLPCAKQIGNFTFCVNTLVMVDARSFADANAIKCFNGCVTPYLQYDFASHKWAYRNNRKKTYGYVEHALSATP